MKRLLIAVVSIFMVTSGLQAKDVLISFDASAVLEMWRDSLQFAKDNDVKYTYFISAPYFVCKSAVSNHPGGYWAEKEIGTPYSKIREDSDFSEVARRWEYAIRAQKEGHEIASHLCGHYDGGKWTEAQWIKEFHFFEWATSTWNIQHRPLNIVGVRAPYLSTNKAYFKVLRDRGYEYDSSIVSGRSIAPPFNGGKDYEIPIRAIEVWLGGNGLNKAVVPFDCNFEAIKLPFSEQKDNELLATVFFDSLCYDYENNPNPTQICLHGIRHGMEPFYEAMKKFVLWAKDKDPRYLTYYEHYLENRHEKTIR